MYFQSIDYIILFFPPKFNNVIVNHFKFEKSRENVCENDTIKF